MPKTLKIIGGLSTVYKAIKNVLMVNNYYLIGGGEHTVFENEVNLLKKNGYNVVKYTRSNEEINKNIILKILLPITMVWSIKTYFDIKKIIKKENIDIIHCHNTFPIISPSVYYAAKKEKKAVVQTIHNFRFLCPNGVFFCNNSICEACNKNRNFKMALKNKCYRNSRIQTLAVIIMLKFNRLIGTYNKINYIFLTEFNKEKFSNLINLESDNVFIKPNFVEQEKQYINSGEKNENKVIFVGRLEHNKGIDFLIENWNKVKDVELHIYGIGDLKETIEHCNNKMIKYFGFQSREIIFKDLSNSMGLIFPSILYEGFPMTITESLSIGKPIICSNVGNHASIVTESKGGVLFEAGNFDSLIEAMKYLEKNYDELSKNAIEYYKKELSPQSNLERLIDIYEHAKKF